MGSGGRKGIAKIEGLEFCATGPLWDIATCIRQPWVYLIRPFVCFPTSLEVLRALLGRWGGEKGTVNFQTRPSHSPTPFSANYGTAVPIHLRTYTELTSC